MSDPWLSGQLTTTAYGWRLERRDGVTLGFTSHDRDVEVEGLLYRAAPGMVPSSITETAGLETDGLDVRGAITADAIRADDLRCGRWDGALLTIFLFDWSDPGAGTRTLAHGELGAIAQSGDSFEGELKGPAAKLDRPVAPYTSPGCRAAFCDAACGLNGARFTHEARVLSVAGSVVTLSQPLPFASDAFAFGRLLWLDGANVGLVADILASDVASLQLTSPPAFPVDAGARVSLLEGCGKTLSICSGRFGNATNFRGEPFLPGNDVLTRYPGAS